MTKPKWRPAANCERMRVGHSVFIILSAFVIQVSSFGLKTNRMPRVKTARRPVNALPARRPFAGVMIVRGGIKSKPGNHSEGVTFARVDGDPSTWAALAVAAKLG